MAALGLIVFVLGLVIGLAINVLARVGVIPTTIGEQPTAFLGIAWKEQYPLWSNVVSGLAFIMIAGGGAIMLFL